MSGKEKPSGAKAVKPITSPAHKDPLSRQLALAAARCGRLVIDNGLEQNTTQDDCQSTEYREENALFAIDTRDDQINRVAEVVQTFSLNGELDAFLNLAEAHAESRLLEFKRRVKDSGYSSAQYELVQVLNRIEKKVDDFPLVTPKQATQLLGMFTSTNPSRDIGKLIKDNALFGFSFGESKVIQLPVFQFNTAELKPWPVVSTLCDLLCELNDWAVYDWMTTFNDDLNTTPADALALPEKYDDLIDLAGLYRNENVYEHLRFSVKG